MRRIIALLSVMAIMAAIMALSAFPAFAQGSQCGEIVTTIAHSEPGAAGKSASSLAGPAFGPYIAATCEPNGDEELEPSARSRSKVEDISE